MTFECLFRARQRSNVCLHLLVDAAQARFMRSSAIVIQSLSSELSALQQRLRKPPGNVSTALLWVYQLALQQGSSAVARGSLKTLAFALCKGFVQLV